MKYRVDNIDDTLGLGRALGRRLHGGDCVELVGDVGAGKTTFTKGLAQSLAIKDDVQSPSFTISREYDVRDDLRLVHYDFYRLHDAGMMAYELAESLADSQTIVVVEWAETIGAVLPEQRIRCHITFEKNESRMIEITGPAERIEGLQ